MTPGDQLRAILAAHGVSPDTVSLDGAVTLLGHELERASRDDYAQGVVDGMLWEREEAASRTPEQHETCARILAEHDGDAPSELKRLLREENGRGYDAGKAKLRPECARLRLARKQALAERDAAEARHRRHLASLRWRRGQDADSIWDRLHRRAPTNAVFYGSRAAREHSLRCSMSVPIAGPFPGDAKRPPGKLP